MRWGACMQNPHVRPLGAGTMKHEHEKTQSNWASTGTINTKACASLGAGLACAASACNNRPKTAARSGQNHMCELSGYAQETQNSVHVMTVSESAVNASKQVPVQVEKPNIVRLICLTTVTETHSEPCAHVAPSDEFPNTPSVNVPQGVAVEALHGSDCKPKPRLPVLAHNEGTLPGAEYLVTQNISSAYGKGLTQKISHASWQVNVIQANTLSR